MKDKDPCKIFLGLYAMAWQVMVYLGVPMVDERHLGIAGTLSTKSGSLQKTTFDALWQII